MSDSRARDPMQGRERASRPGSRTETGSALVLVLLVLLALSALGMVALQDVTRSLDHSGQFRARTNASALAEGASNFMGRKLGNNAKRYLGAMSHLQDLDRRGVAARGGGERGDLTGRGKMQRFVQSAEDSSARDFEQLNAQASGDLSETGLYYDGNNPSFESHEGQTRFEIIIRDPLSGFPLPGFDNDRYCFTRVTVAARGEVGNRTGAWNQTGQTGVGTGIFEAMVGPSEECGQ